MNTMKTIFASIVLAFGVSAFAGDNPGQDSKDYQDVPEITAAELEEIIEASTELLVTPIVIAGKVTYMVVKPVAEGVLIPVAKLTAKAAALPIKALSAYWNAVDQHCLETTGESCVDYDYSFPGDELGGR